ncbi:MAG: serine dehydratase subunit alpha family protein [Tissierellales bacterium]|nr:serine dehydratase subunit alpha family protein [Tissierellales bacterium]MBN2826586.1 serine dehydratase subunit alpha family protein [Tissierellales bacterium]
MEDLYLKILNEELIPALGCTEPIAVAYAAAKARDTLGAMPEKMDVACSGNIIKNVKGVIVPGTHNMKGVDTAAVLGAVAGDPDAKLQVLAGVEEKHVEITKALLKDKMCRVTLEEGVENLYIKVLASKGEDSAEVIIKDQHTNIISIKKNGVTIYNKEQDIEDNPSKQKSNADFLTVRGIYDYINTVDTKTLKDLLDIQISMNIKIAEEGLHKPFGANVGKVLLKTYGNEVDNMAKAYSAAGSDARMGGCTLPVVINSGSGNQGLTVSLPVITYARYLKASDEQLYRALALSNLIAIYIKKGIGKLSAYCGVVSAATGSGAGIAYLEGAPFEVISKTITNTLGNTSGILCDGAKASCAAKVASAVDSAIMGYHIAKEGYTFSAGEGLVKSSVESTIKSIGRVAKEGMKETDVKILNIMLED